MSEKATLLACECRQGLDGTWYATIVERQSDGRIVHRVYATNISGIVIDCAQEEISVYKESETRVPNRLRLGITDCDNDT